jgi:hypothetical protein
VSVAVLAESGLELGQRLFGNTGSDTIVRVDNDLLLVSSLWVGEADLGRVSRLKKSCVRESSP